MVNAAENQRLKAQMDEVSKQNTTLTNRLEELEQTLITLQDRVNAEQLRPNMPPESSITITQPPEFEYDVDSSSDYGFKWSAWIRRFDVWMQASGLTTQSEARKIALLLASAGEKLMNFITAMSTIPQHWNRLKLASKNSLIQKRIPCSKRFSFEQ